LELYIFENNNLSVFWFNLFSHISIKLYKFDFIFVSIKSGIVSNSKLVLKIIKLIFYFICCSFEFIFSSSCICIP
jgi:hypothetical protein